MSDEVMQDTAPRTTFLQMKESLERQLKELEQLRGEEIPDIDRMFIVSKEASENVNNMEDYLTNIENLMRAQRGDVGSG